jgi:hypothetical protein
VRNSSTQNRTPIVIAALAGLLARPGAAHACTVCFGGENGDWNVGFLLGTVLMLALPPALVGGAGIAIYRAMKRQDARIRERDAQRAALNPGTR